jgi:hypothetical protein
VHCLLPISFQCPGQHLTRSIHLSVPLTQHAPPQLQTIAEILSRFLRAVQLQKAKAYVVAAREHVGVVASQHTLLPRQVQHEAGEGLLVIAHFD